MTMPLLHRRHAGTCDCDHADEVERLRRENRELSERLAQAEFMVDAQRALTDLLGASA